MLVQLPSLSPGAYGGAAAAALSLDEVIYSEDGQIDATTDVFTTTNTLSSSYDFTFIIVYGFAQPPHSMTISGTTVNSIAENQGGRYSFFYTTDTFTNQNVVDTFSTTPGNTNYKITVIGGSGTAFNTLANLLIDDGGSPATSWTFTGTTDTVIDINMAWANIGTNAQVSDFQGYTEVCNNQNNDAGSQACSLGYSLTDQTALMLYTNTNYKYMMKAGFEVV